MTTEQLHTIEISGLPEGWLAVAYRRPIYGEYFFDKNGGISLAGKDLYSSCLIIEKIKPRRIVLEETGECLHDFKENGWVLISAAALKCVHGIEGFPDSKIWRLVEEE